METFTSCWSEIDQRVLLISTSYKLPSFMTPSLFHGFLRYTVEAFSWNLQLYYFQWFIMSVEKNELLMKSWRFFTRCFRWYATLENKTPAETFPKFPSVVRVIDMSDRNPPITATSIVWPSDLLCVMIAAVIGGFRSDMSITRKIDENFRNVSAGVLFSKVAYQRKRW